MSRLASLLEELAEMPGVGGAFLYGQDGVLATTLPDLANQRHIGSVYMNFLTGTFSLGHFVQELQCDFDNVVLMIRPVGRGCLLAALCESAVATRMVDLSLAVTTKSVEEELSTLERMPAPLEHATTFGLEVTATEWAMAAEAEMKETDMIQNRTGD